MDGEEAMMGEMSAKGMSEAKSNTKSNKSKKSVEEQLKLQDHEFCCCCVCQCQTEHDRDLGCCGCFPIKCGIVSIGIITFVLFLVLFVEVFYCLLNEYDDWWYVLVGLVLLIPWVVACCFWIVYYASETDGNRTRLMVACQLVIISATMLAIWNVCYFHYLYKYPDVYTGSPDSGYLKQTKKQYIVWSMVIAAAIDFTYAYFMCVTITFKGRMNDPNAAEEDFFAVPEVKMPEIPVPGAGEEEKKDDEEEKKDDAPEGDMMAAE